MKKRSKFGIRRDMELESAPEVVMSSLDPKSLSVASKVDLKPENTW